MKNLSKLIISLFAVLILNHLPAQAQIQETLKAKILKNVKSLPLPDTTRYTSLFFTTNERPEIIATAELEGFDLRGNAIMASRYGKGIVVAVGAPSSFENPMLKDPNVSKFVLNVFRLNPKGSVGIYHPENGDLEAFLKLNKIASRKLETLKTDSKITTIYIQDDVKDSVQLGYLDKFIQNGGTLVFGSAYERSHNNLKIQDLHSFLKINNLLAKAGIVNSYFLLKSSPKNQILHTDSIPVYLHINTILPYMSSVLNTQTLPSTNVLEWFINPTISLSIEFNTYNSMIMKEMRRSYEIPDSLFRPSLAQPLNISTKKQKAAYRLAGEMQEKLFKENPQLKGKAFGIEGFPGIVTDSAKRVDKNISIKVQVGKQGLFDIHDGYFRPHSTGLYVPAGEKIKVILEKKYFIQKLKVQIGLHDDDLINVADQINRIGFNLVRTFELDKDTTEIQSPYGGLLELNITDTTTLKSINLRVLGAVNAPYFKLGETNDSTWNSTIKNYGAPWAELATDKIVFTVPSYRIRNLKNPTELLQFYDKVMDADADLRTINHERAHNERIIVDQQVAYGSLFTMQYKIVAPDEDESTKIMLDKDLIEKLGSWGLFHELGHRHQFWELDFQGLGEVTVNLYSMYVYDKVLNLGKYHNHDNIPSKEGVIEKIKTYMRNNPSYEKFQQDPWIALSMYIELIEQFGWDAIKTANKTYADLPRNLYPKNNEEKIDLWFKTISSATKSDLTDFFDIWRIPVSKAAKLEVRKYSYPIWLPSELKEFNTK
ncbi:M60 family metallopeptidase [Pedobacter fastidiosus]|uniref:Peptidase M60 domain-containing protein n=1 Tax=Pedobacter fastidiosus TaxID=2765361 RepID=A0ABR7KQS4_9SPHI|nr:M60 family metallopeptidase [Pedobacter fastidiosus]MBC6110445.1 hypothetical protein [Pedobacter fastidiosus]